MLEEYTVIQQAAQMMGFVLLLLLQNYRLNITLLCNIHCEEKRLEISMDYCVVVSTKYQLTASAVHALGLLLLWRGKLPAAAGIQLHEMTKHVLQSLPKDSSKSKRKEKNTTDLLETSSPPGNFAIKNLFHKARIKLRFKISDISDGIFFTCSASDKRAK